MNKQPERLYRHRVGDRELAVAYHDAPGNNVVIFCHGFRGQKTGPNRFFVRVARELAERGIASCRFDQYGSGDSDGDFREASFDDWVSAVKELALHYGQAGQKVALLGQSMGASAALVAASALPDLRAVVAWVPDASIDDFVPSRDGFIEEGGQIVQDAFWEEAHKADIARRFGEIIAPTYVVFATEDDLVSPENREAIIERARPNHTTEVFEGYAHSAWTYAQASTVIDRSVDFLVAAFARAR